MEVQERQVTISAVLSELAPACDFVDDAARAAGLDDNAVYHCHLSVEEVCTNIIEHGYHFRGGDKTIKIVCRQYPDRFTITIIDDAPPFNPLSLPDPDSSTPLADREGGGWGFYFVKKYMDEIAYQYQQSQNHLTLSKYL